MFWATPGRTQRRARSLHPRSTGPKANIAGGKLELGREVGSIGRGNQRENSFMKEQEGSLFVNKKIQGKKYDPKGRLRKIS